MVPKRQAEHAPGFPETVLVESTAISSEPSCANTDTKLLIHGSYFKRAETFGTGSGLKPPESLAVFVPMDPVRVPKLRPF